MPTADKLTTPLKYAHYAVVTRARGTATFPVDMLRYDRCYPLREIDAGLILENITDPHHRKEEDKIYIVKYSEKAELKSLFNYARWDSFGWKVEIVDKFELP